MTVPLLGVDFRVFGKCLLHPPDTSICTYSELLLVKAFCVWHDHYELALLVIIVNARSCSAASFMVDIHKQCNNTSCRSIITRIRVALSHGTQRRTDL